MDYTIERVLEIIEERTNRDSEEFYRSLPSKMSVIARAHFKRELRIPLLGMEVSIKNNSGTLIATGYKRVVIGDYGAFIEMTSEQIVTENIVPKWPGTPAKPVKYIWMQTNDDEQTKIYQQTAKVEYADYQKGMYYVSPKDVIVSMSENTTGMDSTSWEPIYRLATPMDVLLARRAIPGETYGDPSFGRYAKENQWICKNPENDHTWVTNNDSFFLLYNFVGQKVERKKSDKKGSASEVSKNKKARREATASYNTEND
jgi:hypothetical protein